MLAQGFQGHTKAHVEAKAKASPENCVELEEVAEPEEQLQDPANLTRSTCAQAHAQGEGIKGGSGEGCGEGCAAPRLCRVLQHELLPSLRPDNF